MQHDATQHPSREGGAEDSSGSRDEEYTLGEHEAVLAATLALMTGFAHGCCSAHKGPIAAKVADQLSALVHQMQGPALSADMQALLLRLRTRWTAAAAHHAQAHVQAMRESLFDQVQPAATTPDDTAPITPPYPDVLWHAPLETLQ